MQAVITVVGKDKVGIFAGVSNACAQYNVNIIEVSQAILQEMFCMIMLVDLSACKLSLSEFSDTMADLGADKNLKIHVMHEDIFNTMHHI